MLTFWQHNSSIFIFENNSLSIYHGMHITHFNFVCYQFQSSEVVKLTNQPDIATLSVKNMDLLAFDIGFLY